MSVQHLGKFFANKSIVLYSVMYGPSLPEVAVLKSMIYSISVLLAANLKVQHFQHIAHTHPHKQYILSVAALLCIPI